MYCTYILRSASGRYYIGYTGDINERLKLHNSKKVISTKRFVPWQLFYKEEFATAREAIHRELQLKSWKSRKALERLKFNKIEDPRFGSPDYVEGPNREI